MQLEANAVLLPHAPSAKKAARTSFMKCPTKSTGQLWVKAMTHLKQWLKEVFTAPHFTENFIEGLKG